MTSQEKLSGNEALKGSVQKKQSSRLEDPPAEAPTATNLLPDVPGDSQTNVVPRAVQIAGLEITLPRWFPLADPGETDTVFVSVGPSIVDVHLFPGGTPIPNPVPLTIKAGDYLQTHGSKTVTYRSVLANMNEATSDPLTVFVDAIDPNLNNQPDAIRLPLDLPGGVVTPTYLDTHGGVTLTMSRPADSRPGDTYHVRWGLSDSLGLSGPIPVTGPIEVTFSRAHIIALGEGDKAITYEAIDRAGNATQTSFPRTATVTLTDPPVLSDPIIETDPAPLITKERARNRVKVIIENIDGYLPTDRVQTYWGTSLIGDVPIGSFPVFPLIFNADYPAVALPGNLYTVDVQYFVVSGNTRYPSTIANADVDLVEPGIGNPDPGPVDDNLELPVVTGSSGGENVLIPDDNGEPATVTFTIPEALVVGDFIDVFYGTGMGQLAFTYDVNGTEAPDFVIEGQIAWSIIDSYGNGTIPCYYRIRNANNYKHSPAQDVTVDVFRLGGLADITYQKINTTNNTILCTHRPWDLTTGGVPVRIFDPATLEEGDRVIVHVVRYDFADPTTPIPGSDINTTELELGFNEVRNGFTVNLDLPYFANFSGTGGRGFVGVSWSVHRPSTGDRGTSNIVQARWDVRNGSIGGTCVPNSTRK